MNTSDADNIISIEQGRETRTLGRSRRRIDEELQTVMGTVIGRTYHDLAVAIDRLDFLHNGATTDELRDEADKGRSAIIAILRIMHAFRPDDDRLTGLINSDEDDEDDEDGRYYNALTVAEVLERHSL